MNLPTISDPLSRAGSGPSVVQDGGAVFLSETLVDFFWSAFASVKDILPQQGHSDWGAFKTEKLHFRSVQRKEAVGLWSPASYKTAATRSKAGVEHLCAQVFDFDDKTPDFLEVLLARLEGREFVLHSSFSHLQAGYGLRFRLVLPLSRPATPAEWTATRIQVVQALDIVGHYDTKADHPATIFYWPSHLPEAPTLFYSGEGRFVEVENGGTTSRTPRIQGPAFIKGTLGESLKFKMKLSKAKEGTDTARWYAQINKGLPFASEGNRDNALQSAVWAICNGLNNEQLQHVDENEILKWFQPSILATPGAEDDRLTLEDAQSKLRRARRDVLMERGGGEMPLPPERAAAFMAALEKHAKSATIDDLPVPPVRNGEPWPEEDVKKLTDKFGGGRYYPILQYRDHYVVLQREKGYSRWLHGKESIPFAKQHLAGAPRVQFSVPNATGTGWIAAKIDNIMETCGRVVNSTRGSFVGVSRYVPEEDCFIEVPTPMVEFEPKFDSTIAAFLKVLTLNDSDHQRLLAWLSVFPNLMQLEPVLYLFGPKHTGKSMLAAALARFWNKPQGADANQMFSNFQDVLVGCPYVVADEGFPETLQSSRRLRSITTALSHTVNRKGLPATVFEGAIRIVVTANDEADLKFKDDDLSQNMIDATAVRFLRLEANASAAMFIAEQGGRKWTDRLVGGGDFARHVRWLQENYVPQEKMSEDARFVVTGGHESGVHDELRLSEKSEPVCQILHKLITLNGGPNEAGAKKHFFWKGERGEDGVTRLRFWVNVCALAHPTLWLSYVSGFNKEPFSNRQLGMILRRLAFSSPRQTNVPGNASITGWFHSISLRLLAKWIDDSGLDRIAFEEVLKQKVIETKSETVDWT